jgi:hypothetical protein
LEDLKMFLFTSQKIGSLTFPIIRAMAADAALSAAFARGEKGSKEYAVLARDCELAYGSLGAVFCCVIQDEANEENKAFRERCAKSAKASRKSGKAKKSCR